MKRIVLVCLIALSYAQSFAQKPAWENPDFVWPMWNDSTFNPKVEVPMYPLGDGPKILIDKAHHNFMPQFEFMKPFERLATSDGYQVFYDDSKFTKSHLSKYDIVIIITALPFTFTTKTEVTTESTFTTEEMESLHNWVSNGGSLVVFSEHAPFDQAINPLLNKFGITSSVGTTIDSLNFDKNIGLPGWIVFSKNNGLLNSQHPIIQGRNKYEQIENLITFGGSSLTGTAYSNVFQLSESAENIKHSIGVGPIGMGQSQCLAGAVEKGKIIAFGDSNGFTAMVFRMGDNSIQLGGMTTENYQWKQFVLNTLHWLSGELN